jgi:hypothetical protein
VQGKAWVAFRLRSEAAAALEAINKGQILFGGHRLTAEYDVRAREIEGERTRIPAVV